MQKFVQLTNSPVHRSCADLLPAEVQDEEDLGASKDQSSATQIPGESTTVREQLDQSELATLPFLSQEIPKNYRRGQVFSLRLPYWLSWRSWQLQSFKANGCWQFTFRSYSILQTTAKFT
jgi:hypothetical protein